MGALGPGVSLSVPESDTVAGSAGVEVCKHPSRAVRDLGLRERCLLALRSSMSPSPGQSGHCRGVHVLGSMLRGPRVKPVEILNPF